MKIKGNAYKLSKVIDYVSCDYIISGKYKFRSEDKQLINYLFEDIEPDFMYKFSPGDILVAGYNFGCGSTREQSIQALIKAGINLIISKSFSYTFYKSAFNNGIMLLECNTDYINDRDELEVDLLNNYIRNINQKTGIKIVPVNPFMLRLYNDGGLINYLKRNNFEYNF